MTATSHSRWHTDLRCLQQLHNFTNTRLRASTTSLRGWSQIGCSSTPQRETFSGVHPVEDSSASFCRSPSESAQIMSSSSSVHDLGATSIEMSPWGPTSLRPYRVVWPLYVSYASFVGRRRQQYYSQWSSRWCCRDWTIATVCLSIVNLSILQSLMNAAARRVFSAWKYDHVSPLLLDLDWLLVCVRIEFKLSVLVCRCLYCLAPSHLTLSVW